MKRCSANKIYHSRTCLSKHLCRRQWMGLKTLNSSGWMKYSRESNFVKRSYRPRYISVTTLYKLRLNLKWESLNKDNITYRTLKRMVLTEPSDESDDTVLRNPWQANPIQSYRVLRSVLGVPLILLVHHNDRFPISGTFHACKTVTMISITLNKY